MKDATKSDLLLGIIIWLFLIAAAIGLISACAPAAGETIDKVKELHYVDTIDDTEIWCTKPDQIKEDGKDYKRTLCALYTPMAKT